MINNKLLILLFIFKTFIYNVYSVEYTDVPASEYQCAERFITKFNLVKTFPKEGGYYKTLCKSFSACYTNGSISEFLANAASESVPAGVQVEVSDFLCFPFINRIYVQQIPINQDLVYYQFPYVTRYSLLYTNIQEINQTLPNVDILYFAPTSNLKSELKLKYFKNVKSIQYNNIYVTLDVSDMPSDSRISSLDINCRNLPNLSQFYFSSIRLTMSSYDPQEFYNNFQYVKCDSFTVTFAYNTAYPGGYLAVPFYLHTNFNITSIYHNGNFQNFTKIYDLRPNTNYKVLYFNTGSAEGALSYQNQIPIIYPTTANVMYLGTKDDSQSTQIPDGSLSGNGKVQIYSGLSFSGTFPKYNGIGGGYGFSGNTRIYGTIDQSWCGTNLIVQNNNLTGNIPSCFTCYFGETTSFIPQAGLLPNSFSYITMFSRFSGNKFTNYVQSIACTTYKPQVKYYNSTTFILSGVDIGFQLENYYINGSIYTKCAATSLDSIIRLGYEYYCKLTSDISQVSYFTLTNSITKKTYTMALKSIAPKFTSITTTNNNQIEIVGSYFSSYIGQSIQNVTIDSDINCVITSGTFTNIICTAPVVLSSTNYVLIALRNEFQVKRVYAVFQNGVINNKQCANDCSSGGICNMYTGSCENSCPNDCSGRGICADGLCQCSTGYALDDCSGLACKDPFCSGNGVCNNTIGQCQCKEGYTGDTCSTLYIECPTINGQVCNNQGTCNTNTGKCQCNLSHQGNDCGLPYVDCLYVDQKVCSGFGTCNNQTGVCTCDSTHQGTACSGPFIQCPIVNNKLCSGFGTCFNQTGVCTCDSSHQGSDCSTPFISCPYLNGKYCSDAGTCNNQTGVCTCDSTHQGSDCSLPLISCPSVNNKVCNSFGTCNNQTGVCTCDSSHQGSSCNLPFISCPSYNGQICNGASGTCNNQTGVCTCDSTHQGNNCGTPFVSCPTYNNKVCNAAGTCNNQTGVCTCDSTHQGSDCSLPLISCPIVNNKVCNGAGTCNNQTGVCTCDSSHQGNNCGTPFISCPSYNGQICNGDSGTCNNQTGVCLCDSTHQGNSCGAPFVSCPTYNGQICNDAGICNNQTGICVCDSSHQGPSCGLPFVQCPSYNDQICNGAGNCNNQTGICVCDSSHQGSSCNLPLVSCPGTNNEICSGAGSCNTQTGKCLCDSSHQGYDCSSPFIQCPDPTCFYQGVCNNKTGSCKCDEGYYGIDCQYFEGSSSSTIPSSSSSDNNNSTKPNNIVNDNADTWKLAVGVSVGAFGVLCAGGVLAYKFKDRILSRKSSSIKMNQRTF